MSTLIPTDSTLLMDGSIIDTSTMTSPWGIRPASCRNRVSSRRTGRVIPGYLERNRPPNHVGGGHFFVVLDKGF